MILPLLKLKEKGKAGLEKVFDEKLKGTDGTEIWRVNLMEPDMNRLKKFPEGKIYR